MSSPVCVILFDSFGSHGPDCGWVDYLDAFSCAVSLCSPVCCHDRVCKVVTRKDNKNTSNDTFMILARVFRKNLKYRRLVAWYLGVVESRNSVVLQLGRVSSLAGLGKGAEQGRHFCIQPLGIA